MTYSTLALILRRRDSGEWDRLYTVLTREHGKLTIIAKGTRRPKAKLASHLEPYALADLMIARGRTIDRVTFARVLRTNETFAQSWEAGVLAAFCVEAVDQLTRDAHRDEGIFDLLDTALNTIVRNSAFCTLHSAFLVAPFALRLCSLLGYTPRMDRCLECKGAPGPAPATGVPDRGGFICHRCRPSAAAGIPLAVSDCAAIRSLATQFQPHPCTDAVAAYALALLETHAWQPLRTSAALADLTRAAAPATVATS